MTLSNHFWRLLAIQAALLLAVALAIAGLAAVDQPASILWLGAFLGAAIGAACMALALRSVFGPLEELSDSARKLAPGKGDGSLPADELGELADVLGRMERDLSQRGGQVQENSQRLQTVLESMIEGVLAVGDDQRILLANDAGKELLDFATPDPVGKPLLTVTRARPVHEAIAEALSRSGPIEREFESPGATRRTLLLRATRLPGDPCPGVMVVLHDVTELRRL
ncbi:MAG: PAS domain-containing protein, partial [Pirellulaceae bacterium]